MRAIMGTVGFILQVVSILIAIVGAPIVTYHFNSKVVEMEKVSQRFSTDLAGIQKNVELIRQGMEKTDISEDLADIQARLESVGQSMEKMRQRVQSLDEDAQNMSEKVKKMREGLYGQSKN